MLVYKNEGCSKIVILGGAETLLPFLEEDQIDEIQLTLVPKILGGENSWTPYRPKNLPRNLYDKYSWELKEVEKSNEHELIVKYLRKRKNKVN